MHGAGAEGVGALKLEVVLIEGAFFAAGVNADDAGSRGGIEGGEEVLDEANAGVVAEGEGVFEAFCVVCAVRC